MLKTAANRSRLPRDGFDGIRTGVLADRTQIFQDLTKSFLGASRSRARVSKGPRDTFWFMGMPGGLENQQECIKALSETDFTDGPAKFDVPTLLLRGDDDPILPIANSACRMAKRIPPAKLMVYAGGSHGSRATDEDRVSRDPLAFLDS